MIFCPVCKSTDVSQYQCASNGNKCHVCLNCGILFLDRAERDICKKSKGVNMENYGYANAWDETPDRVKNCEHTRKSKEVGRCLTLYSCEICQYEYLVDSSD